jgi:hypothetical protein
MVFFTAPPLMLGTGAGRRIHARRRAKDSAGSWPQARQTQQHDARQTPAREDSPPPSAAPIAEFFPTALTTSRIVEHLPPPRAPTAAARSEPAAFDRAGAAALRGARFALCGGAGMHGRRPGAGHPRVTLTGMSTTP